MTDKHTESQSVRAEERRRMSKTPQEVMTEAMAAACTGEHIDGFRQYVTACLSLADAAQVGHTEARAAVVSMAAEFEQDGGIAMAAQRMRGMLAPDISFEEWKAARMAVSQPETEGKK